MGETENVNWASVKPDVVRFVFDQAEKYVSTQLAAGIAADQRATSAAQAFCGFSGAILAASFGFHAAKPDIAILLSGIVGGLGFLAAAWCCFYSARPVDFYYPGNEPGKWYPCLMNPLHESVGVEAENYAEIIADNAAILERNALWLTRGFWAASLAPLTGFLVYIVVSLSCPT